MCQSIASLGGRSKKMYKIVMNDLEELLKRLTQPVSAVSVIDAMGIRPGRPTTKRIRIESKRKQTKSKDSGDDCDPEHRVSCQICDDDDHDTKHCPYHDDLKRFVRDSDGKPGGKACSACHMKGHYISRCPAIRRFRNALTKKTSNKNQAGSDSTEISSESSEYDASWDNDDCGDRPKFSD
jgi:hypothetical protein